MQNIIRSYIVSGIMLTTLVFTASALVPAFSIGPVAFYGSVASADGDGCGDGDPGDPGDPGDSSDSDASPSGDVGGGNSPSTGSDSSEGGWSGYTPSSPVYYYGSSTAPTCSITTSTVPGSSSSVLSWYTSNATTATLSPVGSVALSGSYGVAPTTTTTYTMTVTGPGGSSTCQTVVTVATPPTTYTAPSCTLDTTLSSIQQGQSTSLFWNSTNATSATLTSIGSVATTGSHSVSPQSTTTYVLTVTGTGGSATCSKTVGVTAPPYYVPPTTYDAPYCSLSANQTSVQSGGNVTLYWNSSNAYNAVIDAIGTVQTNGSYTVPNIYGTRTFVMTVQGSGGSRTCSVTVYAQAPVNYYTNYVPPAPVYIPPQPQYVPPAPVYTPAPVQYIYARPASPVRYVTPTRVSLAKVPYTGVEDYMMPLFTVTLALSAAYMLRGALRA